MLSEVAQDKYSEVEFWNLVARQRVYAAFDTDEYEAFFDATLGREVSGLTVLDVGSASGVSAAILAARGARVFAVDISPELITQAKRLWANYRDRIEFSVGDAENLSHSDGAVDVCFFGGVLHHFPDRRRVYAEASRVLRPGGKFVAIEPNRLDFLELIEWTVAGWRGKLSPNEYPIDPFQMAQELERLGYRDVKHWTTRHDIPVLAQFPIFRHFFSRQKGFAVKRPLLRLINLARPAHHAGTFFVLEATKP